MKILADLVQVLCFAKDFLNLYVNKIEIMKIERNCVKDV